MPQIDDAILRVLFDRYVFESEDGAFCVAHVTPADGGKPITVVGPLLGCHHGETLKLRGRYEEHARYGKRFRVESFTPLMPTSTLGIAKYLASGLIDGIGAGLAGRLVDAFGERTLDVIEKEPGRLREVDGIGPKRAQAISESLRSKRAQAEALSFLHALGLGPALSARVFNEYGESTVRSLRENPYEVAERVRGIGFPTADRIGGAVGVSPDDPRRLEGAVLHLLGLALDAGHSLHTRATLLQALHELKIPGEELEPALEALAERELVVLEDDAVYPTPLFEAEVFVANRLRALAGRGRERSHDEAVSSGLSEQQARAVQSALTSGLLVLTGGPGTGKTTTVRAIAEEHARRELRVLLAAPTGRAAKRLMEATGREAKTIHRLLEWSPRTGGFTRNAAHPLEADLVLVDEASMVGLELMADLLAGLGPEVRLVLVGDVDQLPPVGAGRPLLHLLESGVGQVVRLTEIFRQAQASAIVRGAHAILRGDAPEWTAPGQKGQGDLFFLRANGAEEAMTKVAQCVERLGPGYGIEPREGLMVLSPMRRGPLGVHALNERLRSLLNPDARGRVEGLVRGDKVMQLRNDYERDVFNGDLGVVRRIASGTTTVEFDGRFVEYSADELGQLALAYASTVHKVQGSEFDAVCVVCYGGHHVMLARSLIYTALTRARRVAIFVGDPRAYRRAWSNALVENVRGRLVERLLA